jgi:hypothetical protein
MFINILIFTWTIYIYTDIYTYIYIFIESSVAREINFDIVIRNFAGKKARKAHFSKQNSYILREWM